MKGKREIPAYIGWNMMYYRRECKLTQQDVADLLGLERSSYTYYETGKTLPSVMLLKELARYYHISMDELLDETLENRVKWSLL